MARISLAGSAAFAYCLFAVSAAPAHASQLYILDFTKNNNIYTNLNEQFPNTGVGVPGSGQGVPNSSVIFNPATYTSPNAIAGSDLANNGINFNLTSDAAGHDFEQVDGGTSLIVPINQSGISSVYVLASAYDGVNVNVTFTGADSATQTFNNIYLPDFNGGGPINSTSGGVSDQTVFRVTDVGAGGSGNSTNGEYNNYDLTELSFALNSHLSGEALSNVTFTSQGYETLVLGVTALQTNNVSAVPLPGAIGLMGSALLGLSGFAGLRRKRGKLIGA